MRVVLDTNVIVSGLLRAGSPPDLLRQAWESRRVTLVSSEWQLEEVRRVSRYPRLKYRFAPHEAGRLVGQIRRVAVMVDPATGHNSRFHASQPDGASKVAERSNSRLRVWPTITQTKV